MSSSINSLIGSRIKSIRTSKRLTQEELAEKANLNSKHISAIELGKQNPTIDTLGRVAKALEVKLYDLTTAEHEETSVKKLQQMITRDVKSATPEQLKTIAKLVRSILR